MKSYKSLIAWQRASELSDRTLAQIDDHWHARGAALFEQLRRAVISADVNIVEGYALNTIPLFRHHLRIEIGSAAEAERLLQIAAKRGYLPLQVATPLEQLADTTLQALIGLARSPNLRQRPR